MNTSPAPSRSTRKKPWRLHNSFRVSSDALSRVGALILPLAYVAIVVVSYAATIGPGNLGLTLQACADKWCVDWVMPGGQAWDEGARPGMIVLTADGQTPNSAAFSAEVAGRAELRTLAGETLRTELTTTAIGQSPAKYSLWALGGMFVVLGWAIVLRRPDLVAARIFGAFAGFAAIALGVSPAAGGTSPSWSVAVNFLALVGVGASLLPFVLALVARPGKARWTSFQIAFVSLGLIIGLSFLISVFLAPPFYEIIRPAGFLYLASSIFGALGFLFFKVLREPSERLRQQAQLALWGIALGTLPFVGLTLIPEALIESSLFPGHITALAVGLIPAAFAYAILQHQMMGIRKLVHRGMVYGIATFMLLAFTTMGLVLVFSALVETTASPYRLALVSVIVVASVALFYPLRIGAHRLVDRLIYRDATDFQKLIEAMRRDFLMPSQTVEVAGRMAESVCSALNLESVLLFLGSSPSEASLVATAGERSDEVAKHIYPRLAAQVEKTPTQELSELHWESDSLLLVTLALPTRYFGYMLIGPKRAGEIFLEDEKRLITVMTPMLALALDKSELSEELRELNQRLVQAGGIERASVARDLHDGPLQNAVLLAGVGSNSVKDPGEIALLLAQELREICSRLRPAILDDLGVVPSLEWLLDSVKKRYEISTNLSLENISEDDRFPPLVELALFRVTQEAANNAVKHAMATTLDVSLARVNGTLVLTMADDGIGFSPESTPKGGLGLTGMYERIVQINGSFDIQSAHGMGTTVIARIPVSLESLQEGTNGPPHKSAFS